MIYEETVKKIKHEMLLTKEDFKKLLYVSFTTIKTRVKLQPYFENYNIGVSK